MKTPHAILIGLALIAAALFFREPSVSPAQAGIMGDVDGFECLGPDRSSESCFILHGDKITWMLGDWWDGKNHWEKPLTTNWR